MPEPLVLFKIGDITVGRTRSLKQRTIERILDRLAAENPGHTVRVIYPGDQP